MSGETEEKGEPQSSLNDSLELGEVISVEGSCFMVEWIVRVRVAKQVDEAIDDTINICVCV